MTTIAPDLPGAELVLPGLRDLAEGRYTREALVTAMGRHRLREAGVEVADVPFALAGDPLFELLKAEEPDPMSTYRALTHRLVSLLDALDRAH